MPAEVALFLLPSLIFITRYNLCLPFAVTRRQILQVFLLIIPCLMVTSGINYLSLWWQQKFPLPKEIEDALMSMMHLNQPYGLALDIIALALVPAVCEEFFFRGFLQNALSQKFKPAAAIFFTAFFFAVFHLNPWLFIFYLVLGAYFGWLSRRFTIWAAILAHFLNNAYGVAMMHWGLVN